jgi:hypothetical protein
LYAYRKYVPSPERKKENILLLGFENLEDWLIPEDRESYFDLSLHELKR